MTKCEAMFADSCECSFAEDFKNTMIALGYRIEDTISAKLYSFAGHAVKEITGLALTEDNLDNTIDNRADRTFFATKDFLFKCMNFKKSSYI